jgi:hypothetical protein
MNIDNKVMNAFRIALLASISLASSRAVANDGPPAYIFDFLAEQDGQNVVLSAVLAGNIGTGGAVPVSRFDLEAGTEHSIGDMVDDGVLFDTRPTGLCNDYDPAPIPVETICEEHPEVCVDCDEDGESECYPDCSTCGDMDSGDIYPNCGDLSFYCDDCDGDEVPECFGGCMMGHYYAIVDECVPPGEYEYSIRAYAAMGEAHQTVTISVVDVRFDECDETANDAVGGDDEDACGMLGSDSTGCSFGGTARRGGLFARLFHLVSSTMIAPPESPSFAKPRRAVREP